MGRAARIEEFLPTLPEAARVPFYLWIKEHREIWELFEQFALHAAKAGVTKFGAKAIVERIRWECAMQRKGEFKIGNSYVAYLARLFIAKYPEHEDLFELREVKGFKAEAA